MPQVETLVSACAGGSTDRKIACETQADDLKMDPPPKSSHHHPDSPSESFWLSRDEENEWLDRNFIYERKESTKGNSSLTNLNPNSNSNSSCSALNFTVSSSGSFEQVVRTLKPGGYSVMASFLGMQRSGNINQNGITVFTPTDDMVMNRIGGFFKGYPSFSRRHVVPCKFLWNDLVDFGDGTQLPTFLEGFSVNITNRERPVWLLVADVLGMVQWCLASFRRAL